MKRYTPKTPRKKSWTGGNREDREQGQLMAWIKSRYPEALCTTDLAGINVQPRTAAKLYAQRNPRKGWPDITIYEPRGEFALLMLEFKATGADVIKKDGTLRQTQHLKEQAKLHSALSERGYCVGFVVGLENGKRAVEAYLNADFKTLETYIHNGNTSNK